MEGKEKIYGIYLAYAKWEVIDKNVEGYEELPDYPRQFARVRFYKNKMDQLDSYANIPCPASQLFEAPSKEEAVIIIENYKNKFEDEQWLDENIRPFI